MNAIFCCSCGQMPKYSEDSFQILFPGTPTPKVYAGDQISNILPSIKGNILQYAKSLVRNKTKFSYYMAWDEDGQVTEQWDLKKGRRII